MEKKNNLDQTQELFIKKRHKGKKLIIVLLILVLAFLVWVFYPEKVDEEVEATKSYNSAIEIYNEMVGEYNEVAEKAYLGNLDNFVIQADKLPLEDTDYDSVLDSVSEGNNLEKIEEDTKTVLLMKDVLADNIEVVKKLINPSENWVKDKLSNISSIKEIASVTEENDPNGLLNKEGGYSSATYFTIENVCEDADLILKGTDGGGCIEVYRTLDDAEARIDYLKEFDNSYLYTGAYALIGTIVVRITYVLDNTAQYDMMNQIFKEFSKI